VTSRSSIPIHFLRIDLLEQFDRFGDQGVQACEGRRVIVNLGRFRAGQAGSSTTGVTTGSLHLGNKGEHVGIESRLNNG
jgi:hypothetical protein